MSFAMPLPLPRPFIRASALAVAVAALIAGAQPALAQANLATNGSFAITGGTTSFQFGTYGGYNSAPLALPGWSSPGGYNFVYLPTSTAAGGFFGSTSIWGPNSPVASNNGFTNASPTGGNFIAADSAFQPTAITQTINGLTTGQSYNVSFAWAGAQEYGANGASTAQWKVSLGATTQSTAVVNVASHGFSGWMNQTFTYVATGSSQVLSFLANGTPTGSPPFALLANVSVTQVPEPAAMPVMLVALAGLAAVAWRRRGVG